MQGFETFMSSLKNKSFRPNKQGSGVDIVLSCVDNYEARMAVNQVIRYLIIVWQTLFCFSLFYFFLICKIKFLLLLYRHAMNWIRHGWSLVSNVVFYLCSLMRKALVVIPKKFQDKHAFRQLLANIMCYWKCALVASGCPCSRRQEQ